MLTNSFDLKSTAAIKSDNNPNKKLQKIKNKENNEPKKPHYTNIYLNPESNDSIIYVNDEDISLFQNNKPPASAKLKDLKSFKVPTITINGKFNSQLHNYENVNFAVNNDANKEIPLSLKPIVMNQLITSPPPSSIYETIKINKKNAKFNELKVFANDAISNEQSKAMPKNLEDTTIENTNKNEFDLITNSTPLFNDPNNAAELYSRRKQFLNAQLNLTIAPPHSSQNNEVFLVPKVPFSQNSQQYQTVNSVPKPTPFSSTPMVNLQNQQQIISEVDNKNYLKMALLRSSKSKQNLGSINFNSKEEECEQQHHFKHELISSIGGTQVTGSLNISRISAITSETNLVSVVKTEIPKDIKKCLKEELKKDKSKCVLQ